MGWGNGGNCRCRAKDRGGRGSGCCWSCVVCRGMDVDSDVGSDVCDMENPLSRSEFLLKNLHTRELLPLAPRSPCIHINVKINPECVFLRLQRMLNKQQQRERETESVAATIITGQRNSRKRIIAYGRVSRTRLEV